MIITRLWGGLGNQLFQYAAGYALAQQHQTKLVLDDTQCILDKNRPYELHHLQISARPWNESEKAWVERAVRLTRPMTGQTHSLAKTAKRLLVPHLSSWFSYVEDQYHGFQPDVFLPKGHVYLAGTWASELYFSDLASAVRREFAFARPPEDQNKDMLADIENSNAVCIHVRRGDYVTIADTSKRFGVCSLQYYQDAFSYLCSRLENPTAFVFSDDPEWVRENLHPPFKTVYVRHNVGMKNYEDLRLMAACKHFVVANSTFSWWGAWLAANPDKIVIAPKKWSIDANGIDDPVPGSWLRL